MLALREFMQQDIKRLYDDTAGLDLSIPVADATPNEGSRNTVAETIRYIDSRWGCR